VTTLLKGDTLTLDPRLDRVPSFDPLSFGWPVRGLLAAETGTAKPPLRSFTWSMTWPALDQGNEGSCVGHGHGARVKGTPDAHPEVDHDWCRRLYKQAQEVDEWPGSSYEGTSVLAGAKVLKAGGLYESYAWSFGIEDTLRAIGYLGPVVLGINWLESMMATRPSGLLEVSGNVAGGHCILARGVRLHAVLPGESLQPLEVVRLRNSWSPAWGIGGDAFIKVDDLEQLLQAEGEAMSPIEPQQRRKDIATGQEGPTSWP
jgi:hypothetical protein